MKFDKKDVLSWSTSEEAKKYIGEKGFIGNSLSEIREALDRDYVITLQDVDDSDIECFYFESGVFKDCSVGLFLPLDRVRG